MNDNITFRLIELENRVAELERPNPNLIGVKFKDIEWLMEKVVELSKKDAPAVEHNPVYGGYCVLCVQSGRGMFPYGQCKCNEKIPKFEVKPEAKAVEPKKCLYPNDCDCLECLKMFGKPLSKIDRSKPEAKAECNHGETLVYCPKCHGKPEPAEQTLEEEFNKFIKKWCGSSYPHLIDSDGNDGERFRELLRSYSNPDKIMVDRKVARKWLHYAEECDLDEDRKLMDELRKALSGK